MLTTGENDTFDKHNEHNEGLYSFSLAAASFFPVITDAPSDASPVQQFIFSPSSFNSLRSKDKIASAFSTFVILKYVLARQKQIIPARVDFK